MSCPIYADDCDACALCDEIGFCECHDCHYCGQLECAPNCNGTFKGIT